MPPELVGWGGPPAPKNTGMEHGTMGVHMGTGREGARQENVGRGEITARNKQISRETAKNPGDGWENWALVVVGEPHHPQGLVCPALLGRRGLLLSFLQKTPRHRSPARKRR